MSAGTLAQRNICGRTFTASNRTAAHLEATLAKLERLHPSAHLTIIQTCYHSGYAPSAGTHDYDGVFDVEITGLTWWQAQRFLRECGWAAWFRHTGEWADPGSWHIHMASIPEGLPGNPTIAQIDGAYSSVGIQVGIYVPGQIDDYYAHALGLKGLHRAGVDRSWFPSNINATVFRYREDDLMAFSDWSQADKDAFGAFIQQQVAAAVIPNVPQADGTRADKHLAVLLKGMAQNVIDIEKKLGA
jgi:hypothetical protein